MFSLPAPPAMAVTDAALNHKASNDFFMSKSIID